MIGTLLGIGKMGVGATHLGVSMVKGVGNALTNISLIATRGTGLKGSQKIGLGMFGAGLGVHKVSQSEYTAQYHLARYGDTEDSYRALKTKSTIGSLLGGGLMVAGGTRAFTGKGIVTNAIGAVGSTLRAGTAGVMALAKTRPPVAMTSTTPYASHVVKKGGTIRTGLGRARRHVPSMGPWGASGPSHLTRELPDRHGYKGIGSSMQARAAANIKKKWVGRHPFITSGIVGSIGGAAFGTGLGMNSAQRRERKTREGRITAMGGSPRGGIAPSLQFANTQGTFQRMHRNRSRIIR